MPRTIGARNRKTALAKDRATLARSRRCLPGLRRLAATDKEQRTVAGGVLAVLIAQETVSESIRHCSGAQMLDRMFSSGLELNFPVAAPLCIDPADHGVHIVDLHRDLDVDETGF